MIEARTLQGFSDFLPEEMYLRQYLMDTWRHTFESFGYGALDTPALEYEDIFLGKMGEDEKLMYRFEDNGGRKVSLRSDQTVPLARAVVQNQNDIKFPFKCYQIAKVWRADSPRKGRKREFYQCDADIVGSVSPVADAEILTIINQGMLALGFDDFVINISHRGILKGIMLYAEIPENLHVEALRSIDKFDKIGMEGIEKELISRGISESSIPKIKEFLLWQEKDIEKTLAWVEKMLGKFPLAKDGIDNLRRIIELTIASKVDPKNLFLNLNLVRGQDYYTGVIFEANVPVFGSTSLAGGGRYDKLTQFFSHHDLPGVGVGVGLETLYELLKEHPITFPKTAPEILLIAFSNELLADVSNIAAELRTIGKRVMVYPGGAEKMGKQLKYANDMKIPYVLILGPDEAKAKKIQLKNMETGESQTIKLDELVNKISVL